MHSNVIRAAKKLRRSMDLLEYRRINWRVVASPRIQSEFESLTASARAAGFPFDLRVDHDETPNEEVIMVRAGRSFLGVVDRKHNAPWDQPPFQDSQVVETGGDLVASLAATGLVHFIVYPRKSDRMAPTKNELLIYGPLDPNAVTSRVVQKVISRYLLVLQDSSTFGNEDALTIFERLAVMWLYFRELRNRHEFYRSMLGLRNEWGKAVIAGLIAYAVGYYAGTSPPNPAQQTPSVHQLER